LFSTIAEIRRNQTTCGLVFTRVDAGSGYLPELRASRRRMDHPIRVRRFAIAQRQAETARSIGDDGIGLVVPLTTGTTVPSVTQTRGRSGRRSAQSGTTAPPLNGTNRIGHHGTPSS
jgi:indole-3-glycerol phosphate synthase